MKPDNRGKRTNNHSPLRDALSDIYPSIKQIFFFSFFTSILVLAPSGYMLEVYDRVVNSRNHTTLLMLTLLVIGCYILLELLELVRSQIMFEAGRKLERRLADRVFNAVFAARLINIPGASTQFMKDFRAIRDFLPSRVFFSLVDAPIALLILILMFLMHPLLGWFALGGAVLQVVIGVVNDRRIRAPLQAANGFASLSQSYAGGAIRNAQVIESMGMLPHIHKRWMERQQQFLNEQAVASDHAGTNAAWSKLLQSLQSSLVLGFGCLLVLKGELASSLMIVGSMLGSRVLAPMVQIIGNWRQVENAREAFVRLDRLLKDFPEPEKSMSLPPPKGALSVEGVFAGPPGSTVQILKGVGFRLPAGASLAVVGPSASGKTTLARLLVGVWPAMNGKVRLDGSDIHAWNKEELGPYVGYLPQNVELFDGTVAENICRFGEADPVKLVEACRMVGLDEFIEVLPKGYDTPIGADGAFLSGGQRQRVALARAVYGMPKYLVLDEPNSSLDESGDAALLAVLKQLKSYGTTVVVMTHRKNILEAIDNMLVLVDGKIQRHGTRDEVLGSLQSQQLSNGAQPVGASGGVPA